MYVTSAVLDGTDQVRRTERVVDYQRGVVLVRNLRNGVDIGDIGIRVAQRLDEHNLRILLDGAFDLLQVLRIHEGGLDAELGQRMLQQVRGAAVDGLLGHHMVAGLRQRLDDIRDSGSTGCDGQAGHTAFQGSDAVLEHALRGIRQTAVDVAGIAQAEAVGRVLGAVEYIGSGLVDGNGTGIRCGVGRLLDERIRRLHIRRWRIRRMDEALGVSAGMFLQPVTVFPTSFVGKELYPSLTLASNGGIHDSDTMFPQVIPLVSVLHITTYRKLALPRAAYSTAKSVRPIIRILFGR